MADTDLIRLAIRHSGLSDRRFAADILLRDERTIRRYLAGDSRLSERVRAFLVDYIQDQRAVKRKQKDRRLAKL
jgi:hypothetical protein